MTQIVKFEYQGTGVEFDITQNGLMVNATEMAKIFGKLPADFLRLEQTQSFVKECLNYGNSHNLERAKKENYPFLGFEKEEDIVVSKQRSGTWMHRVLALKFAAWLNPTFELWVFQTIDDVLFGTYRRLEEGIKESAVRRNRIDELKKKLREGDDYAELERLLLIERQAMYRRGKENKNQLDLFRQIQSN